MNLTRNGGRGLNACAGDQSRHRDSQLEALQGLYGSVGLTTLLGLLLGARQAYYGLLLAISR
jgi:hypothetical protein